MFNENKPNHNIHCSVKACEFHCGDENYCSLNSIQVASHEKHPTDERCVDCRSFTCKGGEC